MGMAWVCRLARRAGGSIACAIVLVTLVKALAVAASAQEADNLPRLYTNEQYVNDVAHRGNLDIDSVKSVFRYVLGALPDRVKVYPTEDYYYFHFYHGGVKYAGNLRFDIEARDKGLVNFTYFKATTGWQEDDRDYHAVLGPTDGVFVEKVANLVYRVRSDGSSVIFELNDLSEVKPPTYAVGHDETYLGPVHDESGIRFFLMFDRKLRVFHYVLDETVPVNDELITAPGLKHFLIGRRTGFAFHIDDDHNRRILIGVYGLNADVNNYLDGPFDQLPDNFIAGDELKKALVLAKPDIADRIDRLGIFSDEEYRELIAPYVEYDTMRDLARAEQCAISRTISPVYLCFDEENMEPF